MEYEKSVKHISGKKGHGILLFALSTCIWCRMTRELLEKSGFEFSYVYVDLLEGKAREDAVAEMGRWNQSTSFPTLIIDKKRAILGYQEEEIEKMLENGN
ncbi:MAG: glutaredoxin family protein [Candidatus Woesearchaeota archaeon]|nr:glutaredoxin family protein [Candidatus Woesearchaeota archaeon]